MKTLIAILAFAGLSFGQIPVASLPHVFAIDSTPKVRYVYENDTILANRINQIRDTVNSDSVKTLIRSLNNFRITIDADANATGNKFAVTHNGASDTLFRILDDSTARFPRHLTVDSNVTVGKKLIVTDSVRLTQLTASLPVFTTANKQLTTNAMTGTGSVVMSASPTFTGTIGAADATLSGNLTLSAIPTGRIPYTTTAGLVTSGTGLIYNGSAFGVTGTGDISGNFAINTNKFNVTASNGNTSVAGALGVTGLTTFASRVNFNGATDANPYFVNIKNGSIAASRSGGVGGLIESYGVGDPSASNTERMRFYHDGTSAYLESIATGTGTYRPLLINNGGATAITVATNQAVSLSSTLGVTGVTTATGGLTLGASFVDKTTTITSNTTLTSAHSTIFASASGGSFTITLPAASGNTGLTYTIYKTDVSAAATGGGNTVTIDGNASETIGGALTQVLASNTGNGVIRIICDGSNWQILQLYDKGSFTITLTGCTSNPSATAYYTRNGANVVLKLPPLTCTSNVTTCTLTGLPTSLQAGGTAFIQALDNTAVSSAYLDIASAGTIQPYLVSGTSFSTIFTASGTKGIFVLSGSFMNIAYSLL